MSEALLEAFALGGSAFLIGLTGAMSPGPYLTVTITRTVTKGPRSAALMLVGHALLEGLLLIGFAFGLQEVLDQIGAFIGPVLLYLVMLFKTDGTTYEVYST